MTLLRAAVLIDVGYFNKVLKHHNVAVDYLKFSEFVVAQIGLRDSHPKAWRWRTYIYDGMLREPRPYDSEFFKKSYASKRDFLLALNELPRFSVRAGKAKDINEGGLTTFRQKRVDMLLGVDITRIASTRQADVIILIAGDADFVPAVQVAKEEGCLVYVWYGTPDSLEQRTFDELRQVSDAAQEITRWVLEQCKKPDKKPHSSTTPNAAPAPLPAPIADSKPGEP